MAESASIATVNKSRTSIRSESATSVKQAPEMENSADENEIPVKKPIDANNGDQSKAQHQPIQAAPPKRRGKGKYFKMRNCEISLFNHVSTN